METNQQPSCNLAFLNPTTTIRVERNVATVQVAYIITNVGSMTVTDVFNGGTLTFSDTFTIDNVISPDPLTITVTPTSIEYNGNFGDLVPQETVLVEISFDIIGVEAIGDFIISNISNVQDGQGDNINYAENVILHVLEIVPTVQYCQNAFHYAIKNVGEVPIRVDAEALFTIPQSVRVIFRDFGSWRPTYFGTNDPVSTNENILGFSVIQLRARNVEIRPSASVILPVYFDLRSSAEIGALPITASIQDVSLVESDKAIIFIRRLPNANSTAKVLASLQLI